MSYCRCAGDPRRDRASLASRRSCATISALDSASGATTSCTPDDSPSSRASGRAETAASPADGVVHVRPLARAAKGGERPSRSGLHSAATCWWRASLLQRQLVSIVVAGLIFGAIMHGFVLWRSPPLSRTRTSLMGWSSHPNAPASGRRGGTGAQQAAPGGRQVPADAQHANHQAGHAAQQQQQHPPSQGQARLGQPAPPMKLGMPGDSDRLPNQPVWNASQWDGFRRVSPDNAAWPNTLAICAIMKSEQPADVLEWLRYHRCATCLSSVQLSSSLSFLAAACT
jgi:hypothetical protein